MCLPIKGQDPVFLHYSKDTDTGLSLNGVYLSCMVFWDMNKGLVLVMYYSITNPMKTRWLKIKMITGL